MRDGAADGEERRAELTEQLDGAGRPPAEGEAATPYGVFLARVLRPFTSYVPSFTAAPGGLTLAAGTGSRGQLLYTTAELLADRLSGAFAEFPGGHLGTLDHPVAFADLLTATLRSRARTSA